jgi:heme/copper-type cytochrome/quinol oxidase subunit 2
MTDTAGGAQFDFNVLLVIALPVLLGVWIYMIYAIVMWRASRGGPEPVGGRRRAATSIQVGWILTTTVIVLFLAGFGTYELVQPGGAGGGEGRAHLDAGVAHGPADSGDRPAVEVHLPLSHLRRFRDDPAGAPRPHHHRSSTSRRST